MIPVVKPYLPNRQKLDKLIDGIYERQWLTNNGVLVQELTQKLEAYLGVKNLLLVSNGTLALQIAYRALGIAGNDQEGCAEVITTPFTFIATASSLKWEGLQPVFADIDPASWCVKPANIEAAITSNTRALVPVHVFGNPCDVEAIDEIAARHKLKVVYDASHAFGVKFKGESVLNHGDASTLSFHATKLFHTIEGGAIIFKQKEDFERAKKMINFGITGPETVEALGINAKMNEFQAAMGLCVLDEIADNLNARKVVSEYYQEKLPGYLQQQNWDSSASRNYAYMPVVFESESCAIAAMAKLGKSGINARRYFYPSLDQVGIELGNLQPMSISRDISSRILCLPIYAHLSGAELVRITDIINDLGKV